MKNPVLSLFDEIHLNEGGALVQMWITKSNLYNLIKVSLRALQGARADANQEPHRRQQRNAS